MTLVPPSSSDYLHESTGLQYFLLFFFPFHAFHDAPFCDHGVLNTDISPGKMAAMFFHMPPTRLFALLHSEVPNIISCSPVFPRFFPFLLFYPARPSTKDLHGGVFSENPPFQASFSMLVFAKFSPQRRGGFSTSPTLQNPVKTRPYPSPPDPDLWDGSRTPVHPYSGLVPSPTNPPFFC